MRTKTAPRQATAELSGERSRRPQQQRGERRVDAILDAAAALIAEGGAESLTMQALAERARTSKGSLYHFFPDLQGVLCALADRHTAAITALSAQMIADETLTWSKFSRTETIDRFLAPLSYLEAHPDLLALARTSLVRGHTTRRLTPYRDLAVHILRQRCPSLSARQRQAAAGTMVAIVDGVVGYALRSEDVRPALMMTELRRALCAYLGALGTSTP